MYAGCLLFTCCWSLVISVLKLPSWLYLQIGVYVCYVLRNVFAVPLCVLQKYMAIRGCILEVSFKAICTFTSFCPGKYKGCIKNWNLPWKLTEDFWILEDFQIFRLLKMIHIPYCSIVNKFSILLMSGDKILPSHLSNEE